MTEKTYYPFKLLITLLEAQNLPIADYTTSDPFIIAYLGDRQIGRTKVIHRNHLNPKWNETLPPIGLLHTNYELEFKVYDEDIGKDNDFLGNIKIDLKDIPSNGKEIRKRYDMVNAPGYKTKSTVDILILLARNDRVISIQTIDPHAHRSDLLSQKIQQDFLSQPVFESLQRERIWQDTQSEVIKSTVKKLLVEENVSSTVFSVPFLRDLLVEASIFEPPTSDIVPKDYIIDITRNKVKLQNSTKLILEEGTVYPHGPIEECSLQINLTADDTRFVLLTFTNRFMIWSWIKWIRLAYDFWHGHLTKADLPDWASSFVRYSIGSVFLSDGRQHSHKKIILDLANPFVLKFGDGESVSLRTMSSLISSADSFIPSQYILELQIHEKSLIGFQQDGIDGLNVNYNVNTSPRKGHRMSVVGAVGGAITTMKTLTNRGRTLVKETAIGGLTNTVNAVRIISTGDPTKVIKRAQDKILGVTGNVLNTVTFVPHTFFGKSMSFVKVRCRNEIFQFPLPINLIEMHQLDFDFDDLYKKSSSAMQRLRIGSQDQSVGLYRLYPPRKTFGLSMDVTLFHGVEGLPNVYGQNVIKVRNIINTGKGGNASPPPGAERKYSELDILHGEPGEFEVPLSKKIGYSVTLLHANNLILPSVSLAAANVIVSRTIYVKCKLVNAEGRAAFKGLADDNQNSPAVKATPNPVWNHSFPPLLTGDAIDNELYVRVEFFVEDLTNIRGTSIAGCFIPLDYFNVAEHEYTFCLGRFRASSSTVVPLAVTKDGGNKGYGEVTLRLRKIAEDFDHHSEGKRYRVFLQTIIKEASLFNTSWHGEILPVSGIDAENACVERALVTILHDGLQLNEQESMTLNENKSEQSLSVVYDRPTETWNRADQIFNLTTREFVIEVFENERRAPYPPFDWSGSAYTRAHYSDFSFKKSFKFESLKDAAPPDGCDWANEWSVDKNHAKTDEEGWIYGFTFGLIISNYSKGVTYSAPSNCHARRRKWIRKAKLREDEHLEASQVLNSFGHSMAKLTKHVSGRKVSSSSLHSDSSSHDEWRKSLPKNRQQGILATCREKVTEESPIVIDWSEISSVTVITPSILSITFRVHRFFPDTHAFREVEVEMFCSNCPAMEFQSLIKERIWFHRIRCSIKQLVSSGNIYGSADAFSGSTSVTTTKSLLQDAENSILSIEEIPQTEELSLGSDTIKELDDQLIDLQNQVNEISRTLRISHDKNLEAERTILERRIIRLQLYISGLFGISLQGVHAYDEEEIRKLMFIDFQRAKGINLNDDVSTANNRIEFLLDMAEMRIRDAALCGWKHRGGQLENCLETFANGYFIEIVSILGKFFERESDEDAEAQTKGLTSKIELVNTYMKHNDRLHLLISNALRPYGLTASPPAQLSLFLDFNVLVKWYTSTLITEMRSWVNKVLVTWKDVTKDVTGNASNYKFPLPWIPERHSSGRFYSNIPEDLVAALLNYLNYARMNSETVAPHFHSYLGQMDIKVCLAYTNSFLLLSEGYLSGLKMKEWYKLTDEGELSEYCAWVASVMNDARRVVEKKILNLSQFKAELKLPQNEDTEISVEQAISAYQRVESVSIDQMSCLFFIFIFYGQEDLLSVGLAEAWKKSKSLGPDLSSPHNKKQGTADSSVVSDFSFSSFFESLQFYLDNYQDFFNHISYQILIHIVLMKSLVMYLSILQNLAHNGEIFDPTHPLIEALLADSTIVIEKIRSYFPSLSSAKEKIDDRLPGVKMSRVMVELSQEMIHGSLFLLEKLPVLLKESIQSPLFYQVIIELKDFGQKTHSSELCTALASALEIILSLRGVSRYYSSQQQQTLKARKGSAVAVHRNSIITPSKAAAAVSSAAPTHEKDHSSGGPKKRTSILNYFYGGGGGHHSETPHTPPPTIVSPDDSKMRNSQVSIDGGDDMNDFILEEMEHEREQSVIACFDLIFQELRDYNPEKDSSITTELYHHSERKKVKSLAFVHPLVRVFHQTQVKFSLMHDLVLSAVPGKSRDAAAVKKKEVIGGTPGTPTPKASDGKKKTMNFNFVTGLFTRGGSDADHLAPIKMKTISSLDEDDYESSTNNLSTVVDQSPSSSAAAGEGSTIRAFSNTSEIPLYKAIDGEPFIILTFYELKLFNLFFVDMFGQPKPYFVLQYRDFLTRSRAQTMTTEMETCWSDETPIQVPIYEVTSSTIEILIQVYYEGYLNDHCIGQVVLAFSPYDLPAHRGKKFDITFNPHSKKVQQALTKTKTEGRDLLSLSFSTNASKCKRHEDNA